jgi:hypothetical protein
MAAMNDLDALVRQLISLWESRAEEIEGTRDLSAAKLAAAGLGEAMTHLAHVGRALVASRTDIELFEGLTADLAALQTRIRGIQDVLCKES